MSNQKTLKERRNEAEKLVEQIRIELAGVKGSIKDSLSQLSIATKAKSDFQKLLPQINRISDNANSAITKIRDDRDRLSKLLTTVNNFYNKKYTPLVDKINDPNKGLNARIKQGNNFEKELQNVRIKYGKQIDLINQLSFDFRKKLNELKLIESSLRKINSKILDQEKTVTEKRIKIEEDSLKVEASTKNILESEKTIFDKEQKISKLHLDCEKAFNEIITWHTEADETLVKIRKIYEIAMGTGLGGEFDKRRKLLETESNRWQIHLFYTTIGLFSVIVILFTLQLYPVDWDITKLKFDGNFYVRFLITSPFIYYLVFETNQYNRVKVLLEKYAFKTTLALSIEAHINLLTGIEDFKEKERLDKIIDFILDGFSKIYDAPYQKETKAKGEKNSEEVLIKILDELKTFAKTIYSK